MSVQPAGRPHTTLIILNPHAASGRAGAVWKDLEPLLWERLGELIVAVTQHPDEVGARLDHAYASGVRRVISIGGDGTNHALVNALIAQNQRVPADDRMIYGNLPIGTGRDWARGIGMPIRDLKQAADWIARAQPTPLDIGRMSEGGMDEYFLNIASAGLGGAVSRIIEKKQVRRPWTFLQATVQAILSFRPQRLAISLDGQPWFDDRVFALVVANGTTFGHGMKIAPHATPSDGMFDVVLVRAVSRPVILTALRRVYDGSHLTHPAVMHGRARQVTVRGAEQFGMELDGESADGRDVAFSVVPSALQVLM
jgi:diacylglycerol kinase (ATP)